MYDHLPTKEEQMKVFNTSTLQAFNELNYDKLLFPSNIQEEETYIRLGIEKDATTINGFSLLKKHYKSSAQTQYFVRVEDINKLPILIINTRKVNYSREVFNLVTEFEKVKIEPEQKMSWKELVDFTGCPYHSNEIHYTLYKMKCLYARTKSQVYFRTISDSCFGKTKYLEMLNLMLNHICIISDASSPKLFFAICHQRMICLNEMPDKGDKNWSKFCNNLINIGDKSKSVENPSRKTEGTFDCADTSKLSMCFTHNCSSYYHNVGLKGFDELFPYNVINRYYYNLYDGLANFHQSHGYNAEKTAKKYQEVIRDVIKTALFYEDNWDKIQNPFPEELLDGFKFENKEPRFKEHFYDFANAIAEYSQGDVNIYMKLLVEEYKSHIAYKKLISNEPETTIETDFSKIKDVKK